MTSCVTILLEPKALWVILLTEFFGFWPQKILMHVTVPVRVQSKHDTIATFLIKVRRDDIALRTVTWPVEGSLVKLLRVFSCPVIQFCLFKHYLADENEHH